MFTNKTVLISGGTGSFGTEMLKFLVKTKVKEIRILSRDDRHTLFKVKRILTIIVLYCIINIVKNKSMYQLCI